MHETAFAVNAEVAKIVANTTLSMTHRGQGAYFRYVIYTLYKR